MTEILNLCCDHNHSNPLFSRCSSLWWSSIKLSLATKRIMSSEGTETYCDYISPHWHCDFDLEDSNPVYTAWYSSSWRCTTIHRYWPEKTWTDRCTGGIQDVSKFLNLGYHPPPQAHLQPPPPPKKKKKKKKTGGVGESWETALSPSKTEDLLCQMGFSSSWKKERKKAHHKTAFYLQKVLRLFQTNSLTKLYGFIVVANFGQVCFSVHLKRLKTFFRAPHLSTVGCCYPNI